MGLTVHKTAALWPLGIVPYVLEGGFPPDIMKVAAAQYARAGIRLIQRTNQSDFLLVKMVTAKDPDGLKSHFGFANSSGFVKPDEVGKMYRSKYHRGNAIWILNDRSFPQLVIPSNFDFTITKSTPEAWRKFGINTVLQQIGLAIGLRFEAYHPDAQKHIKPIYPENTKEQTDKNRVAQTRFDINSIMMLCTTFKEKGAQENSVQQQFLDQFGQQTNPICDVMDTPTTLSELDVKGLSKLYAEEILKRNGLENAPTGY